MKASAEAPEATPSLVPAAGLMQGKRGVVFGIANDKSLAWGITHELLRQGARVCATYQNDALRKRVEPLAEEFGIERTAECDLMDEDSLTRVFAETTEAFGGLDFVVHAVAFSDKNELKGRYVDTSRENFTQTLLVSCYSFTRVCREAAKYMTPGGSLLTLTYYGAEKVTPHYNVMGVAKAALESSVRYLAADLGPDGVRVNAISAGPVKTLAASGIGDFRYILHWNKYNSPLRRNTTLQDVGGSALYLLSDLASGVTGEVLHVDSGYHVVGMKAPDAPDITVQKYQTQEA